ncbi:LLM class flavin-dependent oxidoreductase [Streptomyces roseicoloratus]|uniref:LLM class flavin-dependent oxidoreductase n=1 Tax=Streptomyces roseicoloratus TaxID=2508722 RepID=UPI001009A916|nr:LLM class flavin-dependent oxidoreductase [Streptomyces roseicoloratus]
MRLGINLVPEDCARTAQEAERLGFDVAAAPEGFRSDAISVLGWVAARTTRIGLLSTVIQIPARTPVAMALAAATLDGLSGGRFRLGLGISNSHVTEGWHGAPFARPLARTREYVDVVRRVLAQEPVTYEGRHYALPLPGSDAGPFRLPGPVRRDLPVYLAAVGTRGLELTGEIADGWVGVFCTPEHTKRALDALHTGRRRAGREKDGFDAFLSAPAAVGEDVEAAAAPIRPYVARFMSLGDRESNFYFRLAAQMGYAAAAEEVQDRFQAGDATGAARAVPLEFIDSTSLLGPPARIARRLTEYAAAGITTLGISPYADTTEARIAVMETVARAHREAGLPGTTTGMPGGDGVPAATGRPGREG